MQPSNIASPAYFHKVVDCQWACPAHTPVPEYIRLIAQGRFDEAYMVNWVSNVFPGILGRTCDRPCEPACRRGRVEEEKVLSVKIPAGVDNGDRIRLAGEGEAGFRGGPAGDLYIFLSVKPHRIFKRDGANILCYVPLRVATAALGDIDGDHDLDLYLASSDGDDQVWLNQRAGPIFSNGFASAGASTDISALKSLNTTSTPTVPEILSAVA